MKKILFILFSIFPHALFSQEYGPQKLPLIFSLNSDELKILVNAKTSDVKMSEEEIVRISKIIDERKEEYINTNVAYKKSVPRDANGKPTGLPDPELLKKQKAISNEVCTSIYEILGDKRYEQFSIILGSEAMRRSTERLNNAMKNKKK